MLMHQLAQEIRILIADMPDELVITLADALENSSNANWNRLQTKALAAVPQPAVRNQVEAFLEYWRRDAFSISAESVSLALLTAVFLEEHHRHNQQLELVWTGPDSEIIPLRRTDQALLQLIDEAKQSLNIVSFAVYKADAIAKAIVTAIERGVSSSIYLETPDESEGKITYNTIKTLGAEVANLAKIYVWPLEERLISTEGKHGSLHAKLAVADGHVLLISSANLTEYAMTLNMEMGLLIRGGTLPEQVESHLRKLIEQGVFKEVL